MTGTALDMTSTRQQAVGPVYAAYGTLDPGAVTLAEAFTTGLTLAQVPLQVLVALETGSPALVKEATAALDGLCDRPLIGAFCLNDYWNTTLRILNPGSVLDSARDLVADKAALYPALTRHGAAAPGFIVGTLGENLLEDALDRFGPCPILKPARGAGSRGVYRYRSYLSIADNLALYRELLSVGNIDSSTPILGAAYVGGEHALEISVDVIAADGQAVHAIVHEKLTATQRHPFVDRVMASPPEHPAIIDALPQLPATIAAIITTLALADGALHVELRLESGLWHVLDVGVRPGAGLIPHSVQALTGVDPRLVHLAASLARPLTKDVLAAAVPSHSAAALACCYIAEPERDAVTLARQADLTVLLREAPDVLGWHLNACESVEQIYRPDAGLSVGLGAATPSRALQRLRSIVEPFTYSTT
ncbi:ATP-grasp domain-containing protein [Streptosporangium lutulentum]|uniref:ATP-grasp domain-containing protein n=1 Tax=Streptosporangium lutulentum TaxID=1461250 RepID=A0ABT9QUJ7_9ACTN|nr:ATP-grasp domain-containing protein [Streptosporangium lutulentum]MDP9850417.1 hypothetical protein [Streptosporangium lutulentum]